MDCTLRIINGVPDSEGVVIKEAGAVFAKKSGGTSNDGPRIVNLTFGQHADFQYHGSECITEVFGAIEITIPGKPNQNHRFTKVPTYPGVCMRFTDAVLAIGGAASSIAFSIDTSTPQIVDEKPQRFTE